MDKKVLFVCVQNAGRSQMAEAFFNHLAQGIGKAKSAGTRPAERVDDNVMEIMREAGIEIGNQKPKQLTSQLLDWADRVITMGCGVEEVCPATFVETEDWSIEDPKGKPVAKLREIRDEIHSRVVKLIAELTPK